MTNIFLIVGTLMQLMNGQTVLFIEHRVEHRDMAECIRQMIEINQDERAAQVAACVQRWPDDRVKARPPVKSMTSASPGRVAGQK